MLGDCSNWESSEQQQMFWGYDGHHSELIFQGTRFGDNQVQHPTFLTLGEDDNQALNLNAGTPGSGEYDYFYYNLVR